MPDLQKPDASRAFVFVATIDALSLSLIFMQKIVAGLFLAFSVTAIQAAESNYIYSVVQNGKTLAYLYGGAHGVPENLGGNPSACVRSVIEKADTLFFETLQIKTTDSLRRFSASKTSAVLAALTDSERSKIESMLNSLKVEQPTSTIPPLMLINTLRLANEELRKEGAISVMVGAESQVMGIALREKNAKRIGILERYEEQVDVIDRVPVSAWVQSLRSLLEMQDSVEKTQQYLAWAKLFLMAPMTGNEDVLVDYRLHAQSSEEWVPSAVTVRDQHLSEKIGQELKNASNGMTLFVNGALHLPGPGGLVDLLRRQGYQVERACTSSQTASVMQ